MVCEDNETDLQIGIPVVMLPQDAGASLEKYLLNSTGMHLFFTYSSNLI
jgi:signal peptide peptidase-like protein 2B